MPKCNLLIEMECLDDILAYSSHLYDRSTVTILSPRKEAYLD